MLQKTQPRTQDNLSVEHYVEEYCELCNLGFNDVALKDIFLWGSWWNHCFLDAGQHISLYIYSVYSISLALKLSGWPFTVGEVKEDFSAYPTVDTILAIQCRSLLTSWPLKIPLEGAILYVPSLTSHGLHGSQVWRPCTAETGGPTFSDRKSCDPRGHPIVLGASHSHHHFSVCVWAAHIFPDMAVSTTTPSEKSVCSVTVHVTATETVHKISAHPIVPCSVMPVQPWAWRPPLNSPGSCPTVSTLATWFVDSSLVLRPAVSVLAPCSVCSTLVLGPVVFALAPCSVGSAMVPGFAGSASAPCSVSSTLVLGLAISALAPCSVGSTLVPGLAGSTLASFTIVSALVFGPVICLALCSVMVSSSALRSRSTSATQSRPTSALRSRPTFAPWSRPSSAPWCTPTFTSWT